MIKKWWGMPQGFVLVSRIDEASARSLPLSGPAAPFFHLGLSADRRRRCRNFTLPPHRPPSRSPTLSEQIVSLPNVRLGGIQACAGQASHTVGFENRMKVSREAVGQAVETRRLFEKKGIACPLLSGGSTLRLVGEPVRPGLMPARGKCGSGVADFGPRHVPVRASRSHARAGLM
jgi:hypothetical protein